MTSATVAGLNDLSSILGKTRAQLRRHYLLEGACGALLFAAAAVGVAVALGMLLPVPLGGEFQLRGGPSMTYTDPLRPERAQEHSELLVEVQGRLPLLFALAWTQFVIRTSSSIVTTEFFRSG